MIDKKELFKAYGELGMTYIGFWKRFNELKFLLASGIKGDEYRKVLMEFKDMKWYRDSVYNHVKENGGKDIKLFLEPWQVAKEVLQVPRTKYEAILDITKRGDEIWKGA